MTVCPVDTVEWRDAQTRDVVTVPVRDDLLTTEMEMR